MPQTCAGEVFGILCQGLGIWFGVLGIWGLGLGFRDLGLGLGFRDLGIRFGVEGLGFGFRMNKTLNSKGAIQLEPYIR